MEKTLKLEILKPVNMNWGALDNILKEVRHRVFRLSNMYITDFYRVCIESEVGKISVSDTNKKLGEMIKKETWRYIPNVNFAKEGALNGYILDVLYKERLSFNRDRYIKIHKGEEILKGFHKNISIPISCNKQEYQRLERIEEIGENRNIQRHLELNLMVTLHPYPRIRLNTRNLEDSQNTIITNLLSGVYVQYKYEVKQESDNKWYLFISYYLPEIVNNKLDRNTVVGVDMGYSCPLYVVLNKGEHRMGWDRFGAIGERIKHLRGYIYKNIRNIRKYTESNKEPKSVEKMKEKVNNAYTTLNHQLSKAVIDFALNNGAGVIQLEDLNDLRDKIKGTFLGKSWRTSELTKMIKYKAKERGIFVREISPLFTSMRCHKCGHINTYFTGSYRAESKEGGRKVAFKCMACGTECDSDYNAAKNISCIGITDMINTQLRKQGLK